jgi:hypothetical protein
MGVQGGLWEKIPETSEILTGSKISAMVVVQALYMEVDDAVDEGCRGCFEGDNQGRSGVVCRWVNRPHHHAWGSVPNTGERVEATHDEGTEK